MKCRKNKKVTMYRGLAILTKQVNLSKPLQAFKTGISLPDC